LNGLALIHADVWMRGTVTTFYVREKARGGVMNFRMAYVFGEGGFEVGTSCPGDLDWAVCAERLAEDEGLGNIAQTCSATIDVRAIPVWKPSPDGEQKRRLADELRHEIEAQWKGAREIVIRDFNLKDPEITIYVRTPDGEYFQGGSFHVLREPHCGWHLFGQAPYSSLRKWVFKRPYRLK